MEDDKILVSRVLNGDMKAFHALVSQHERLVAHMVGRLIKDVEDREEICQDVFVKVYQKLGEFQHQSQLSTWIATIAYRHAINHLRKKKLLTTELPDHDAHWADVSAGDPDSLADDDMEAYLMKLVERLPAHYRIVLTLYHLDHKNYAEIGEITSMPEGTVKNYLFRARQLLKEQAKKYLRNEEWI